MKIQFTSKASSLPQNLIFVKQRATTPIYLAVVQLEGQVFATTYLQQGDVQLSIQLNADNTWTVVHMSGDADKAKTLVKRQMLRDMYSRTVEFVA